MRRAGDVVVVERPCCLRMIRTLACTMLGSGLGATIGQNGGQETASSGASRHLR